MWVRVAFLAVVALGVRSGVAEAGQLGTLVSPGPLARAHASLNGGSQCQQCHQVGRRVTVAKCVSCHQPIAARITAPVGVHRNVTDCVSCHIEHAGEDGDLRHFDTKAFNHAASTRFPLDGLHAPLATNCAACHKSRSFLQAKMTCSSCHTDVHKGALGPSCATCHATTVPFKASRQGFDHSKARFPLTGAHVQVRCERCHKTPAMRGVPFATCASCHTDPHQKKFGPACATCHQTTDNWTTRRVDHARTEFPLRGAHAQVACAGCHTSGDMTRPVRFDQCSSCHTDVHRGSFKQDCVACHTEQTFKGAPFDHAANTSFPLDGAHAPLQCMKCHTNPPAPQATGVRAAAAQRVVDFKGASRDCVSCHAETDPHKGAFGRTCNACHRTSTFDVKDFRHPRAPEFFSGQHQPLRCEQCHIRGAALPALRGDVARSVASPSQPSVRLVAARAGQAARAPQSSASALPMPSMTCVSCHADVHLGQVGAECERCHSVDAPKFAAVGFTHDRSRFPLTGKHTDTMCVKCHPTATGAFPSGAGTAMVLHPPGVGNCQACHADPHMGQMTAKCDGCHQTTAFAVASFEHRGMEDFFGGVHGRYACADCHKKENGTFPAGQGTAVRYLVGRSCAACHRGF